MHLGHAKQQRAYIKEVLKTDAERVLPAEFRERGIEEFNASIDRWVCDHETDTPSSRLFLSKKHEAILKSVGFDVKLICCANIYV